MSSVEVTSPPRMTTASGCSISWPGGCRRARAAPARARWPARSSGSARAAPRSRAGSRSRPNGIAFCVLEMPVVADQHDAVARGDAEHRHEADQRAERQHAAGQERGGDGADQRERQRQEHQRRQPRRSRSRPAGAGRWPRRRRRRASVSRVRRGLARGVLAEDLGVVAALESDRPRNRASMSRATAAEVAAAHVAGHVDAPRAVLARDLVRRRRHRRRRPRCRAARSAAVGDRHLQGANGVEVARAPRARPRRRRRRSAAPRRTRRPSCPARASSPARRTSPGRQAERGRRARVEAHLDLRHQTCASTFRSATPSTLAIARLAPPAACALQLRRARGRRCARRSSRSRRSALP